jgi:hypothetical protein
LLLYAISIPWYRTGGAASSILWGLPDWVAVAIACYVGAAVLNAIAWLVTDVPDVPDGDDAARGGPSR